MDTETTETPADAPPPALDTAKLGAAVDALEERRASPAPATGEGLPTSEIVAVLPGATGHPGFVIDEGEARGTPCTAFDLGEGQRLTFSEGILGALDEGQVALYCPETVVQELTDEQRARALQFKEAGDTCGLEVAGKDPDERLDPWMACMSKEAKRRGVKL